MWLFLLSLGILFAAATGGYLLLRVRAEAWPPPGMPALPAGLWLSTALVLLISAAIQWALLSVRRDRSGTLIGALLITTLLALLFLVSQAVNWAWLIAMHATAGASLYLFTFYLLTGLHGAHVLGGLGLQAVVTARAFAGRYSAAHHAGVKYAAMYWHFLDVVWLVLFTLLFLV